MYSNKNLKRYKKFKTNKKEINIEILVDNLLTKKTKNDQFFSPKKSNNLKIIKDFFNKKATKRVLTGFIFILLLFALWSSSITSLYGDNSSNIIVFLEPRAVYNGDTIQINVSIPSYYQISYVTADMGGNNTVDLYLLDNSSDYHIWTGNWIVQNMSSGYHTARIFGEDIENISYSYSIEWKVLNFEGSDFNNNSNSNNSNEINETINDINSGLNDSSNKTIPDTINDVNDNFTEPEISDKEEFSAVVKPENSGKAFDKYELSKNILGPSSLKIINMTYFWDYFDKNSNWFLEVFDSEKNIWTDITDSLKIYKSRSENNQFEKISLAFTAPITGDYRLTYKIDKPLKSYINKSNQFVYELFYPVEDSEEYSTYFDFSDIAKLSGLIINHGIENNNGDEFFWFSAQRNNIAAGTNVLLDPTFGNTATSTSTTTIENYVKGGLFQMGSIGGTGNNISAYLYVNGGAKNAKCALYYSNLSLVPNSMTEEKSYSTGWNTFNFGATKPVLQANTLYYIVVWSSASGGGGDLYYATSGGSGVFSDSETYVGGSYTGFPSPFQNATVDADGLASIYCSYNLFDVNPPTPDPLTWATEPYNASSSSITMVATTASDSTPPISYYFNETTGNPGGTDSGWQASTTYTDSGLSENTQYGYEVKARDSNSTPNEGNYSTPISYEYTDVDPPTDGELNLTAGISWVNATVAEPPNPTSGLTGSYFNWITGGAANSGWQSGIYFHNRTGLTENTQYGCQVRYRNGDGDATIYNPTEITNYTLLNPPTDGEFTIDGYDVTWMNMSVLHPTNPSTGSTAAYFECVTGGGADSGWVTDSESGRYYYNVTGLLGDTTYGFRVKYRNANGYETSYTSEKQQTTNPPLPPVVVTNESRGVEETNATMRGWLQFNGTIDTTCYFLLNDTNDFGIPILNLSKGIIANGYEFENDTFGETILSQGKLYYYKAQANNSVGWIDGDIQMFLTKPETITSFTATMFSATQINLSWTDEAGGDGAYIEYAENSEPSPWNVGSGTPIDADGNVTSPFSHTGLNPGTTYYYKAWAYATDDGWTSSGNQTAPRGDNPQTTNETTTGAPSVVTKATEGIEETNATLVGQLQSNGTLDTTCYFLWGVQNPPTDYNVSQGIVDNGADFKYDTSGTAALTQGTLYFVDTKANNLGGWNESGGVQIFLTKPDSPTNLIVQRNSSSKIYLTWNTGTGFNTTYIERNQSGVTSWGRGEGIFLYNDSGNNYEDTGLTEGVTYYYQAWSFTNWSYDSMEFYQWSDNNASGNNKTNNIPTIDNEVPANESTGLDILPQLSIDVNDFDGDSMTITWYSNSSGSWQVFGTNISVGNGTYYQINNNFSDYSKTYYWNISLDDGYEINDSDVFHFSTESLFTSVNPISPYIVTSSPKVITATGDTELDKVSLYYKWSDDNESWDSWDVLTYDDFESGFGNYTAGGGDCSLYTGGTYAHQGNNAADIQDDTGDAASFYHTTVIDVDTPSYTCIKIEFWFYTVNMDSGHDFFIEYFNGTTEKLIKSYVQGTDFVNDQFYFSTVWINETEEAFPSDMYIKFRCDALNDNNDVYIDEIYVNATTQSAGGNGVNWTLWNNVNNPDSFYPWDWNFDFPNGPGFYEFYSIGNKSGSTNESAPASADARCRFNRLPTITNEVPSNGSTNIQLIPQLNISVNDMDADSMNVTWYSNSSGSWQVFGVNNSVLNGTYYQVNSNFSNPGTIYWWYVSVYDGVHTNTSGIFYFRTSYQPVLSNPAPDNNSIGQYTTPVCNVTVSDADGGTVTVRFYENSTGGWVLQQTNSSVDVTNPVNVIWNNYSNATQDYTTYWWMVNVSDGKGYYAEEIYHFTTANTSIEVTPSRWDQGVLVVGSSNETTGFYFNLTNNGDVPLYIQVKASNATNVTTGAQWTLNATSSFDNFTLQYNKSSGGTWTTINLTYDLFMSYLEVGSWQTFDLKLIMATLSSTVDPLSMDLTFRSIKA